MALTSASTRDDALAQFRNSLRYWESAANAGDLAEAIIFLMPTEGVSLNAAGRSWTREQLETLRQEAIAHAKASSASRPPLFARTRVTGMGRY